MTSAPAALLALVLFAGAADRSVAPVVALAPLAPLHGLAEQALARPPDVVVRTPATFGPVTFDHRKHLAARAACARCHGPGPAGKVELGARIGHARCISCHTEQSRGPTGCTGCHAGGATGGGTRMAAAEPAKPDEPEPPASEPPPEPVVAEPVVAEPAVAEPVVAEPTVAVPAAPEPAVAAAEPAAAPEPSPRRASTPSPGFLAPQPLPPPPGVVVRTLETFGSVTFDHRKHLAARAACARCHGPGRVGKVELGARIAHSRCISCHTEVSRGPAQCTGCHDRSSIGPRVATADAEPMDTGEREPEAAGPGPAEAASPARPSPAPVPHASEAAQAAAAQAPPAASGSGPRVPPSPLAGREGGARASPRPSRQLLQLGFDSGTGLGGSLRIASRGDQRESAYSIVRLSGGERARVLMLFDYGIARPMGAGFTWWAVGTAGFDAQEVPALGFSPSVGARIGLEWSVPVGWFVRSLHLSVTGVLAVAPRQAFGDQSGGGRFFFTVATGLPIPGIPAGEGR